MTCFSITKKIDKFSSAYVPSDTAKMINKSTKNITVGGKSVEVPVRMPVAGEAVIIDALNYVVTLGMYDGSDVVYCANYYEKIWNDDEVCKEYKEEKAVEFMDRHVRPKLCEIFGDDFNLFAMNAKGLHKYKYQFTVGSGDCVLAKVCFGGNKGTCLVMVTGKGCYFADTGFENRLYDFLSIVDNDFVSLEYQTAKLTRIDLALDDFDGAFSSAELADDAESNNEFMLTANRPNVQHLGDWKYYDGRGRTLLVGNRENGKFFRGYEKGNQLGDKDSPWFRSEVEFKNKARVLPFDMLLNPTSYFAGAYPYAVYLVEQKLQADICSKRINTMKKESELSFDKAIEIAKVQFGRLFKFMRDVIPEYLAGVPRDTVICDLLETDKRIDYTPKRLRITKEYHDVIKENKSKLSYRAHIKKINQSIIKQYMLEPAVCAA